MKKMLKFFIPLLLLILFFVPTQSAQAQGPNPGGGGQVIFGSNFTVKSGDVFDGDLVLLGGNVTIEAGATLRGDVVVIGGTIKSDGEVQGDVVVVGGQVSLEKTAVVTGDVVTIGGQVSRAEGAQVRGQVVNNAGPNVSVPNGRIPPSGPDSLHLPFIGRPIFNFDFHPFQLFFFLVGIPAFAMLLSLFWQAQIERTGKAIITQPLMTGAIGLASVVVAAATIILLLLVVPLLWFFGVIAMGSEVGERFTRATKQTWSPVVTVGFGTFLLMLAGTIVWQIPCLGALLLFLLGLVAVGATVMTLFGTRPIQVPALAVYTPPSDAGQAPPVG